METVKKMMSEQNGNINKEIQNLKRSQNKILALKSTVTEIKDPLAGFKGRLGRQKND